MHGIATVNLDKLVRETGLKITITGSRRLALRLRIAAVVMGLAGRIAGPNTQITVEMLDTPPANA